MQTVRNYFECWQLSAVYVRLWADEQSHGLVNSTKTATIVTSLSGSYNEHSSQPIGQHGNIKIVYLLSVSTTVRITTWVHLSSMMFASSWKCYSYVQVKLLCKDTQDRPTSSPPTRGGQTLTVGVQREPKAYWQQSVPKPNRDGRISIRIHSDQLLFTDSYVCSEKNDSHDRTHETSSAVWLLGSYFKYIFVSSPMK